MLSLIYDLDALFGISKALIEFDLTIPSFTKEEKLGFLEIKQLYNLLILNPIKNDVMINSNKNIWFLTGGNMTGKSTLMKSIATSVYLAHLGFPVPADQMTVSLFGGLFTTINLGDDIVSGYSHFLNEVRRVKDIAMKIKSCGNLLIVLDELFKGTNYQDAYEASERLMTSFSEIRNCVFIISSHITEIGNNLSSKQNIDLKYLKTNLSNGDITFTYKLESGIAKDRLGMWLLEREEVFKILKKDPYN